MTDAENDQSTRAVRDSIDLADAQATLARCLSTGYSVEDALVLTVVGLLDRGHWGAARALAEGAGRQGMSEVSQLCLGLAAQQRGWHWRARQMWADVPDRDLLRWAPVEAVEAMLLDSRSAGRDRLQRMLALVRAGDDPALRVDVAARLLAVGRAEQAGDLVDGLDDRDPALDASRRHTLSVIARARRPRTPEPGVGGCTIGLLCFDHLDGARASNDLGDYLQTLALVGHLVRHTGVTFSGQAALVEVVEQLRQAVPDRWRLTEGPASAAHLVPVPRDASSLHPLPGPTWLPAFGWHMQDMFGLRYDFPYHRHIRPLFVSWHLGRPDLLTPDSVAYLQRYGPVGCRDWTTVFVLLSAGVDAFFTGCLTSTLDGVVAGQKRDAPRQGALIDAPARVRRRHDQGWDVGSHLDDGLRSLPLAPALARAHDVLSGYQARYRRVITSRVDTYLAATSVGIQARLVPRNPADPRLTGLRGMAPGDPAFVGMQHRIRSLLEATFTSILSGETEAEVYRQWRELTAPWVAEARARHDSPPVVASDERWGDLVEQVGRGRDTYGPDRRDCCIDVALSSDANLAEALPVTIEGLVTGTDAPLSLWILCRGLGRDYRAWLADAFPTTRLTFLPCDGVEYGPVMRMIEHITDSTLDRLLLPEVLNDVDRLVYLDIDALMLGDVADLAATPLHGRPFAARSSYNPGHAWWWRTSLRLGPDEAEQLRWLATRARFGYRALNAGVLVMDLARLRQEEFTRRYLPYVERFGLNDQDVLMAYGGDRYEALDPRWNSWPLIEGVESPLVVHYLGASKPWQDVLTPSDGLWMDVQQRVQRRVPWPPPGVERGTVTARKDVSMPVGDD